MKSILNSCAPRPDIISGTFNPEIFTASLSEVFRFYSDRGTGINAIYTDAEQFFKEGTYRHGRHAHGDFRSVQPAFRR